MIKLFEAFAGYGGASFALKKAGIEFECIGFSEIDKYAQQCYEQNHEGKNFGDISKIKWRQIKDFDLLTGGFPCQDISQAGKQDLTKGRSNLVNELIRCLKEKQPKYFLFENVGAIETAPMRDFLLQIERDFRKQGYQVFRKKMNSKDFGVPQNRERVWWIGYRKDIAKPFGFGSEFLPQENVCQNLTARDYKEPKCVAVGCALRTRDFNVALNEAQRLANENDKPIQLDVMHLKHGELRPLTTYIPQDFDSHRCLQAGEPKEVLILPQKDSMVLFDAFNQTIPKEQNVSTALRTNWSNGNAQLINKTQVRRLTPRECFRLMGFLKDEINLEGLSDTQKYKLAGNGWDINLVSKVFEKMELEI